MVDFPVIWELWKSLLKQKQLSKSTTFFLLRTHLAISCLQFSTALCTILLNCVIFLVRGTLYWHSQHFSTQKLCWAQPGDIAELSWRLTCQSSLHQNKRTSVERCSDYNTRISTTIVRDSNVAEKATWQSSAPVGRFLLTKTTLFCFAG